MLMRDVRGIKKNFGSPMIHTRDVFSTESGRLFMKIDNHHALRLMHCGETAEEIRIMEFEPDTTVYLQKYRIDCKYHTGYTKFCVLPVGRVFVFHKKTYIKLCNVSIYGWNVICLDTCKTATFNRFTDVTPELTELVIYD